MSLIALESFDAIATADLGLKYTLASTPEVSTAQARTGGRSLLCNATPENIRRVVASADEHATFIIGVAVYVVALPAVGAEMSLMAFTSDAGGTTHVCVDVTNSGGLQVRRSGVTGPILGSGGSVSVGAWNFIECRILLSDTVGTVDLRLNGASVISLTGQDTKNVGTKTVFDGFVIGNIGNQATAHFDDVYVCNGAGTVNNGFLGDLRVRALLPNGNGNSSQLLGSDGNSVDNYLLVDDPLPDTSDYVGSATLDAKDTYAFGNLPDVSGTVLGVQINAMATKTDTAARNLALVTRSAGTDYDSSDQALPNGSNTFVRHIRELDPATAAAWTREAVNAAEFGAKVR